MAFSSSSSTEKAKRRIYLLRESSREVHYEGPMMYCKHGLKAHRWTSWTDVNPGRRFYGCRFYNHVSFEKFLFVLKP